MICLWSEGTNSLIWIWCFCGLDLPFFLATNPSVKISRMSHGLLLQGKVTEKAPVCTGGGSVESISLLMLMLGPFLNENKRFKSINRLEMFQRFLCNCKIET